MKTDLLDHGYVRLVSYTQPAEWAGYKEDGGIPMARDWTGDLEVVRAARVSYNADWRKEGDDDSRDARSKDEKLIHYLWSHRHTSPFEHMSFAFEVQAPIFVFRQWHRHRTQAYNEISARYTELPDLYYVPSVSQVCAQSTSSKQGRALEPMEEGLAARVAASINKTSATMHEMYRELLATGLARELARLIVPVNTYSRMYASASMLNWFRFIGLRSDLHAQYEIRVYSDAILKMIETVCPISVAAFNEGFRR